MNSMGRRLGAILVVAALIGAILPLAGPASAVGTFDDDDGNTHEADIEAIAALGITKGCNPPDNTLYCPDDPVTRAQMASLLVRALNLATASSGPFTDISGNTHEADINALAASGITKGCNPPGNSLYCPDDPVTRGQMAAFIVRALNLIETGQVFADAIGHTFEQDVARVTAAGITKGCNPPENTLYCPDDPVTRAQIASFLVRALNIPAGGSTATTSTTTDSSTSTTTTSTTSTSLPPVECSTVVFDPPVGVDPPVLVGFGSGLGGLCDVDGDGTGLVWAAPTSNGSRYEPSLLDVAGGVLSVTTTGGLFETSENTQTNALAVPLSPQVSVRVEASIVGPPAGTGSFEQGGLWFGNGEDDYIKVVFLSIPTGSGYQIQARYEEKGLVKAVRNVGLAGLPATVDLRLDANHGTLEAQGQYSLDGGSTWLDIGTPIAGLPNSLFTVDQAGTTTETFTGIITSDRGGPEVVFDFDHFTIEDLPSEGGGGGPLAFTGVETQVDYKPTSMAWHGTKLYVLDALGVVHRYDVNSNGTLANHQSYARLPAPSGGIYTALGLAIEPGTSLTDPTVWVSTSITGGSNFLEGVANSSTVWRIPNLATGSGAAAMITGLPRAFENHAINSIRFYDGQLYIAQGGNTGAGEANDSNSAFGSRPEQPLAAAWLRADVLSGWSPSNDGDCATAVDDGPPPSASKTIPATCSVEIVATGLRNMYDFVKHSNNNFYGPDNGLGVIGTVPETYQPDCQGYVAQPEEDYDDYDPGSQPDRLHILDPGKYYGHPNPARDECVFFNGVFQTNLHGTTVNPLPNYTPAHQILNTASGSSPRSLNSIIEYDSGGAAFGGEFDGDLLITAFAGLQGLYHYDLAETCGPQQSAYNNGCLPKVDITINNEGITADAYLSLTQINNGRLAVGDWNSRTNTISHIVVLIPGD